MAEEVIRRTQEKMLICPCSTRVYMDWQLSPCMDFNIRQDAPDTVELIHLLLRHPTLMPTSFHFSQGQWQIGTLFRPPPESSSLLIPSRKPSTSSQTLLLIVAEQCHSSSNGWSPIAGYPLSTEKLKNRYFWTYPLCGLGRYQKDSVRARSCLH